MQIPHKAEEWVVFIRQNVWSIASLILTILVCYQGLTLVWSMRSWSSLEMKMNLLSKGGSSQGAGEGLTLVAEKRRVEATFFYRPVLTYNLTAILGDRAVVNGQEVKVGERVGRAMLTRIDIGSITLLEDGSTSPKQIDLHQGL